MLELFQNKSIRSRIMKAINERITKVEKEYSDECGEIDFNAESARFQILEKAKQEKEKLADTLVKNIIGKII